MTRHSKAHGDRHAWTGLLVVTMSVSVTAAPCVQALLCARKTGQCCVELSCQCHVLIVLCGLCCPAVLPFHSTILQSTPAPCVCSRACRQLQSVPSTCSSKTTQAVNRSLNVAWGPVHQSGGHSWAMLVALRPPRRRKPIHRTSRPPAYISDMAETPSMHSHRRNSPAALRGSDTYSSRRGGTGGCYSSEASHMRGPLHRPGLAQCSRARPRPRQSWPCTPARVRAHKPYAADRTPRQVVARPCNTTCSWSSRSRTRYMHGCLCVCMCVYVCARVRMRMRAHARVCAWLSYPNVLCPNTKHCAASPTGRASTSTAFTSRLRE